MKLSNRMVRKIPMFALLATSVFAGPLAHGARIDETAAMQAASSFLGTATGRSVLPDRTVESIMVRGSLRVAVLSPSGHILVSGSDRATPIIGFSENDFSEGEEDSPERAALDAADAVVAAAEADETKGRHARWEKIMANGGRKLRLLASSGAGVNIEPFITSRYNQCQPWNDMTPVVSKDTDAYYRGRSLAGCVSVADAALFRAVRWPVYPARTDTVTHSFRGGTFDIRFDGSAPFKWDLMEDTYPVAGDLRGRLAEDVRYEVGHFMMWLNHSARMTYNAGESTSTKYNAAHGGERDWYTIGRNMVPTAEGVEDIVTTTLAAGIPVFVGVGGHAVVADGWKTEDDEAYVDLVYGWGGAGAWYSVESGPVKYFWVEHYPRAKPQLDPIPRVIGDSVTLSWHFPDCYTNCLYMFFVTANKRKTTSPTTWTADFSDASTGSAYPDGVWTTYDFGDGSVALDAMDLTYGFYQFSTPLTITENSVLSLNVRGGGYNSGDANSGNVVIEICGDDGNWRELFVPECNWSFWPGSWKPNSCSLAAYAGQTVQLRIYKRHTTYNGRVDIGDFKVTNVIPLDDSTFLGYPSATDRSITLTGLDTGADYAFSVRPYLYGALVSGEPSDAKIASVATTSFGMPEFSSIQYAANGNSAQDLTDGYLADGSIGSSTLYVACSGAVTNLTATPSHLTLVSNETVHVSQLNDGRWKIAFDPSIPENRNRQRMILTLHATDSNGTTAHRDIVMRMTADSGIEGGAEQDDDIILYTPKARPIAAWNGDFNGATTRGAVTLNLNGNITTNDGAAVVKTAGKSGIDFAIAGGGTSILGIAGISDFALTSEKTATLMTVSTAGTAEDAGIGISCESSTLSRYRGLLNSGNGQWSTAGNGSPTYPSDGGYYAFAFSAKTSGIEAWTDGESKYKSTYVNLDGSAVNGLALGGWKNATVFGAIGAMFNYVAIFTNAAASADDVFNWNLKNMTGAVTVPASGGALTTLDTGRNLGINLNGGRVALDEPIYAAAIFVQDNTTLEVPMGFAISSSRVLYVAPGKTLTVDVICDGTALSNAVSAAGGVYTSRILQGANYGDIVAGSLPDIGSRYTIELVQVDTEGVYFRVTDTRALDIYNDDGSGIPVGYVTDGGKSCTITNATGLITIPAMIEQVNIYAKDDVLNFMVASGTSPNFAIYASNAAGGLEYGSGWGIPLTSLFAHLESGDDTIISLALNPEAVYNGVKVRPEFDTTAGDLLSFSGTGDGRRINLPIKVIPGLWYCVDYADNVRFTNSIATDPVSVTTTGTTNATLSAPAVDASTFYRVRAGASKAAVSTQ
ncbi:MAG: C10 family peptidase [Kiritimatiellae bacterium]|nr:C10 family peptidase [Kiritimatiellia bacterium]